MSSNAQCAICSSKKVSHECGLCHCSTCKACTSFLDSESFRYIDVKPASMESLNYCLECYAQKVLPELHDYEDNLAIAKEIAIFDITQTKETRLIKRKEAEIKVQNCVDREEATLKLAYQAVKLGFNSVIDVDLKFIKIVDGRYQTSEISGKGIPANVSNRKLVKDRSIRSNPN